MIGGVGSTNVDCFGFFSFLVDNSIVTIMGEVGFS